MNAQDQLAQDLAKLYKALPARVAVLAKRFVDKNFRLQAWQGSSLQAWAQRKATEEGARRALLIKSGRLRRATTSTAGTGYALLRNNTPYAEIHNEGGLINKTAVVRSHRKRAHTRKSNKGVQQVAEHTVSSHQRRMNVRIPRRQFMGDSPMFDQHLDKYILKKMDEIEKDFINNNKK